MIGVVFTALGVTTTISNDYATGNVTGGGGVGGLIGASGQGYPEGLLYIQNSSSYGKVNGVSYVGGILGQDSEGYGYTFLIGDKILRQRHRHGGLRGRHSGLWLQHNRLDRLRLCVWG